MQVFFLSNEIFLGAIFFKEIKRVQVFFIFIVFNSVAEN